MEKILFPYPSYDRYNALALASKLRRLTAADGRDTFLIKFDWSQDMYVVF